MKNTKRKLNWKNIGILAFIVILLVEGVMLTVQAANQPELLSAEVDMKDFYEDNHEHYSRLVVKQVPTFQTKDSDVQQLVVVANFNAWYKGGYAHLVLDAKNGEDVNTPEGRKTIPLDKLTKEEAEYYKSFFPEEK